MVDMFFGSIDFWDMFTFGNDGGLLMIISCKLVKSGRCSFVIV